MNRLNLGGKTLELTPLPFGVLKKIQPQLGLLMAAEANAKMFTMEQLEAMSGAVLTCLQRADPSIDLSWVDEYLTLQNIGEVVKAIFEASDINVGEVKAVP